MKRLLSILLLLVFVLPALAPVLAATGSPDDALPACCRRNGKHHCAMRMQMLAAAKRAERVHGLHAPFQPCPFFPRARLVVLHHEWAAPGRSDAAPGPLLQPSTVAEAACLGRLALARCRGDRGPPSQIL